VERRPHQGAAASASRKPLRTSLANNAPYCALNCHDGHPKGRKRAPAENHFAREQRTLLRLQVARKPHQREADSASRKSLRSRATQLTAPSSVMIPTPKGGSERQQKTTSLANNAPYCAPKCHESHTKGRQRAPAENHFAREQRTLLRPQFLSS